MNRDHEIIQADVEGLTDDRVPWHAPELETLHVSLDTQFETGSGADLGQFSSPD
ncbi:hypothetical protein [Thiohalocapsa marina]|uniref:hypothetical protein n=1 Tax=Thiohalocapsa marina TaxID=424902 RepID=UPI001478EBF0|nr:hypothetical protein [Thiohalocapsa marina]